ncbi:hypothetical protein HRR83_004929 [Exophiala dermatitidis]|uniref:BTB/POZ domain-containing protein 13 n=2 Tax=Exophiala dermatitidis TaxID=5970 RepID=H6C3J6_EXODN|nr:BTB/POZ domain-containing protein 13 [Exophiala dermatitidis NIH/UT8656]KAJ4513906.1 hypothetical protein HRR75_004487 [Exophiala dermatitidis]EHY58211.1 BTB/POZ domain-containing protein 13 [Exophiala dermatitidis NIH/UT8656]KAJ4517156.1 hypothetical protein HRR74_004906 [Exophiala dermatitidis]KAJ4519666.1 hypothetical protein HRR73_003726 [Exophiala dermatitidis]KAJ4534534.1 hypothetical protein HRR76_006456 [Exophiala dermatitidis]
MDQEQFSGWGAPRDDIDGLIAGLEASVSDAELETSRWRREDIVASSSRSTQYPVEPSSSGIVRSPLQQPTSGTPTSRPLPQRRAASASQVGPMLYGEQGFSSTTFEPPLRSIFVSGPPTASVSANTALASLSGAMSSSTSGPFAALTNAGGSRRPNPRGGGITPSPSPGPGPVSNRHPLLTLEKDVDDPTASANAFSGDGSTANTSAALARLFAPSDGTTPAISRGPSHLRPRSDTGRSLHDTSTLIGHLLHNGFEEGRHSDITVYAFGQGYKLHKLLLDRVPFFSSAFSGSWLESTAKVMTIAPEESDPNITKVAFELALKRIYGTQCSIQEEEEEAVGLFATACWLDMPDLIDSCVESILRQMQPATLHSLIKLVTNNYYGKPGDRILSSAKAMLCREGWEMPYEYWDDIPAEMVREIIGGDPFFIPGEWDRWYLALKLLNRRLRAKAVENGLVSPHGQYLQPKPSSLQFFAVRFDTPYRVASHHRHVSERDEPWIALYTSPEISPILVLLDEGIHYVHLRFEQLQQIRSQRDILGVPVLPEKVISDALWMSLELRQKVLNAKEDDIELGLSELAEDYEEVVLRAETATTSSKGKLRELGHATTVSPAEDMESGSWDGNGKPRKFWIPDHDVSCVMGGTREASTAANTTGGAEWSTQAARLSASLEPTDVAWAFDFGTGNVIESGRPPSRNSSPTSRPRYSHYPPFRFSAEFPNPRTLKERKRVYSHTVWYAGSMWNLYIQRVNTGKLQQLGIYLHRAKDKEPHDDPLAQFVPTTVDDRIGQLEREMLLRKSERRNQAWRLTEAAAAAPRGSEVPRGDGLTLSSNEFDYAGSVVDDSVPVTGTASSSSAPHRTAQIRKTSQTASGTYSKTDECWFGQSEDADAEMLDSDEEDDELLRNRPRYNVSAIPPYMDSRPTIKTYFKIYSPSRAGRLLSIYESAPDQFDLSKSWGWKSPQMQLDDGLGDRDISSGKATSSSKEGRLRYMVVIGNI